MNYKEYALEQKKLAREKKAKLSIRYRQASFSAREPLIHAINNEQQILKFKVSELNFEEFKQLVVNVRKAEMPIELPGAAGEDADIKAEPKINFGQFLDALEKDVNLENYTLANKQPPKQDDLVRWARKLAFMQYYKNMSLPPETPITKAYGDAKTLRQLSPNKDAIYNLYLDKLEEFRRRSDKFKLGDEQFNEVLETGTQQGGAFEKWLERHREEIMNNIYRS